MNDDAKADLEAEGGGNQTPEGGAQNAPGAASGNDAGGGASGEGGAAGGGKPEGESVGGADGDIGAKIADAVSAAMAAYYEKVKSAAAEAERQKGLSPEEKLAERERELDIRSRKYDAAQDFTKRGLPVALVELLDFSSDEALKKSEDTLDKVFREVVQLEVNKRLTTGTPGGGQPPKAQSAVDAFKAAFTKND